MHIDTLHPDSRQRRGACIGFTCACPRDAEFVAGLAGRYLRVGQRIDIRVDAERDGGLFLQTAVAMPMRDLPKAQIEAWIARDEADLAAFKAAKKKA